MVEVFVTLCLCLLLAKLLGTLWARWCGIHAFGGPSTLRCAYDFFLTDRGTLLDRYTKRYGSTFATFIGRVPFVMTSDPDLVRQVLTGATTTHKSTLYSATGDLLDGGVSVSTGEKFLFRKSIIMPVFHHVKSYTEVFEQYAERLLTELEENNNSGPFNVVEMLNVMRLQSFFELALRKQITREMAKRYNENAEYMKVEMFERTTLPYLWYNCTYALFFRRSREYYRQLKFNLQCAASAVCHRIEARHFYDRKKESDNFNPNKTQKGEVLIRDYVKDNETFNPKKDTTFIDSLLDNYVAGKLDLQDVETEVRTLMLASELIATNISWCLHLLGNHPQVQRKLQASIDEAAASDVTLYDKIQKCRYLDNVIKECMRLHSPGALVGRSFSKDTPFKDKIIRKGTQVLIIIGRVHRNPQYWQEPDRFLPERFDDKITQPFAYIPFSRGNRTCIGQKYALLQTKVVLFKLLTKYDVIAAQNESEPIGDMNFVHESKNGIFISIKPHKL